MVGAQAAGASIVGFGERSGARWRFNRLANGLAGSANSGWWAVAASVQWTGSMVVQAQRSVPEHT